MPNNCKQCKGVVFRNASGVKCNLCNAYFHLTCTTVKTENVAEWICEICEEKQPPLYVIMEQLKIIIQQKQREIFSTVNLCHIYYKN